MPRRRLKIGKIRIVFGTIALVLALPTGAVAYFTSTEAAARNGESHSTPSAFTLESRAEPTGLYPGGTRQATVKVENIATLDERYKKMSAEVHEVEDAASTETEAEAGTKCWAGWYEITEVGGHAGTSYEFDESVPGGSSVEKEIGVRMKEVDKNEDGCENKKVTLEYKLE